MPEFAIAGLPVGPDHPPYVIAEAGVHHYDSLELAKAHVLQARIAGVQAIKFQTYTAKRLTTHWAELYWKDPTFKTQFEVFAAKRGLSHPEYAELVAYAQGLGITFLSTPFDTDSADLLAEFEMAAYKIASADLTNRPLLDHVARKGKPVLLSTGASTFEEIAAAAATVAEAGAPLALLHCSLAYPTPVAQANLGRIRRLAERFGASTVIGYSDHTQPQLSEVACPAAVALGARVIEKHFTLNKHLGGDDHYHAVDAEGLKRLVRDCADAFRMCQGDAEITEVERAARSYARRSIVAARDLPAGTVVQLTDLDFKRPGTGLSPTEVDQVVGRRLLAAVPYDGLLLAENLAAADSPAA